MTALYNSYRPTTWDEVIGQDAVVKSLRGAVQRKSSQCYVLSGPSGLGKTTLARIASKELGCDDIGRSEIDAATYTGVDDMRQIQSIVQFRSLGSGVRSVIIDEAHNLSKNAWDSLLKTTEEPPPDVYWFFCTTNPAKLPKTIITRSMHLQLREIDKNELTALVEDVAKQEGIKLPDAIRQLVVAKADGSARQALVNLDACRDIKDRAEAAEVLQSIEDSDESLNLLRMLAKGGATWVDAMRCLKDLNGANPESIRIQAMNYFAAAARNARNDRDACYFLAMMDAFAVSYANFEAQAQLLRSIGLCIFRDDE